MNRLDSKVAFIFATARGIGGVARALPAETALQCHRQSRLGCSARLARSWIARKFGETIAQIETIILPYSYRSITLVTAAGARGRHRRRS
jgi:hypothetical protein